jgi:hypothetical protein
LACAIAAPVHATESNRPNVVLLLSDDYAWPYYGFMQRWLGAMIESGELGDTYQADESFTTSNTDRHQLRLPDDDFGICGSNMTCQSTVLPNVGGTVPLHKVLTPALDRLAAEGQYFPVAHLAASKCEPGMAGQMTGLHLRDLDDYRPSEQSSGAPVLPEWLPGFRFEAPPSHSIASAVCVGGTNDQDPCVRDADCPDGSCDYYLTMMAGKWQWSASHLHEDTTEKRPFDVEKRMGSECAEARQLVNNWPPMRDVKKFIACSMCKGVCANDPNTICDPANPPTGCGTCEMCDWENGQSQPYHPLSGRVVGWDAQCQSGEAKPFFLGFSPYIPHLTFDLKGVCPNFERGPTRICRGGNRDGYACIGEDQCGTGDCVATTCWGGTNDGTACSQNSQCTGGGTCVGKVCQGGSEDGSECTQASDCPSGGTCVVANQCDREPYKSHSAYCNARFCSGGDRDGQPCFSENHAAECPGSPSNGTCDAAWEHLSCEEWAANLESIALNLAESDQILSRPGGGKLDVYNGSLADKRRPTCVDAYLGATEDCENTIEDTYHDSRFSARGKLLEFINTFDRSVDELIVFLKETDDPRGEPGEKLWDNTVILYNTDNGFQITNSKGQYAENGFRSPIVFRDPYQPATLRSDSPRCAGEQGCNERFAHFGDIVATICDHVGSECDPQTGTCHCRAEFNEFCSGTPPCEREYPDPTFALSKVSQTLRLSSSGDSQIERVCQFPEDDWLGEFALPLATDRARFGQCLFGMRGPATGDGQGVQDGDGWYVVAEIEDDEGLTHLCKYYHEGCDVDRLYDLTCDPNERSDLTAGAGNPHDQCTAFCSEWTDVLHSLLFFTAKQNDWERDDAEAQCRWDQPYCGDTGSNGSLDCYKAQFILPAGVNDIEYSAINPSWLTPGGVAVWAYLPDANGASSTVSSGEVVNVTANPPTTTNLTCIGSPPTVCVGTASLVPGVDNDIRLELVDVNLHPTAAWMTIRNVPPSP